MADEKMTPDSLASIAKRVYQENNDPMKGISPIKRQKAVDALNLVFGRLHQQYAKSAQTPQTDPNAIGNYQQQVAASHGTPAQMVPNAPSAENVQTKSAMDNARQNPSDAFGPTSILAQLHQKANEHNAPSQVIPGTNLVWPPPEGAVSGSAGAYGYQPYIKHASKIIDMMMPAGAHREAGTKGEKIDHTAARNAMFEMAKEAGKKVGDTKRVPELSAAAGKIKAEEHSDE